MKHIRLDATVPDSPLEQPERLPPTPHPTVPKAGKTGA